MDVNDIKDMMNDENFDPKKTMDGIEDLLTKANTGCPVHKINFSLESPGACTGLYLMTFADPKKLLIDFADLEGLTDDTYLYFEPRHIMEVAQIMYAIAHMLAQQNYVKKSDVPKFVDDIITRVNYCTYKNFKNLLDDILYKFGWLPGNNKRSDPNETVLYDAAMKRLDQIFKLIWFVPYVKLDEMAAQCVAEYNARKQAKESTTGTSE